MLLEIDAKTSVLGKRKTPEMCDTEAEDKVESERKRRRISPLQREPSVTIPPLPQTTNNLRVSQNNDEKDNVAKVIGCISES